MSRTALLLACLAPVLASCAPESPQSSATASSRPPNVVEQLGAPVKLEKRLLQPGGQLFLSPGPGSTPLGPLALGGPCLRNCLYDAGSGRLVDAAHDADPPIREVEVEPSPKDGSVDSNLDDLFGGYADALGTAAAEVDRTGRTENL